MGDWPAAAAAWDDGHCLSFSNHLIPLLLLLLLLHPPLLLGPSVSAGTRVVRCLEAKSYNFVEYVLLRICIL